MNKWKETRPGADTPRRAMDVGTGRATTSTPHFITPAYIGQVADLLSCGAKNGVNLRHLVSMTCLSEREVRAAIQHERLNGVPILSDNQNGYFLPGDQKEIDCFLRSMRHRAKEILAVADAVGRNRGVGNEGGG